MPASQDLKTISVKLPLRLLKALDSYAEQECIINRSSVIRDAIKEKIEKERPELLTEGV